MPKCHPTGKPGYGKYCSRTCKSTASRRVSNDDGTAFYRVLSGHQGHPLASEKGWILEHRKVLYDAIGPGPHPCHQCGIPVNWAYKAYAHKGNLTVDHLDENRFNNAPENLAPACGVCNQLRSMKKRVKDDEIFVVRPDGRRARATQRTCLKCGTDFLVQTRALKTPNRGLYCSRQCGGLARVKAGILEIPAFSGH